jgi:hypothetical protein
MNHTWRAGEHQIAYSRRAARLKYISGPDNIHRKKIIVSSPHVHFGRGVEYSINPDEEIAPLLWTTTNINSA